MRYLKLSQHGLADESAKVPAVILKVRLSAPVFIIISNPGLGGLLARAGVLMKLVSQDLGICKHFTPGSSGTTMAPNAELSPEDTRRGLQRLGGP